MASKPTVIEVPKDILDAIYAGAKQLYPRESFLLLRGKKNKGIIKLTDLVLAPFAVHGHGFANFNPWMFSGDFSLVGTVHSHPSGNISPSDTDMNYFFSRILMIVGYPFEGQNCIAAYDCKAERIPIQITDPIGKENDEILDEGEDF